jgi:hypothetical protein
VPERKLSKVVISSGAKNLMTLKIEIGDWKLEIWPSRFCTVDKRIQFWDEFHISQISIF